MAHYISPEVADVIEDPGENGPHRLVLVVEEDELRSITARAGEYDVAIEDRIEPNILIVEIAADEIEEFCRPSYIQSVSFDEGMQVMDTGNLSHPQA